VPYKAVPRRWPICWRHLSIMYDTVITSVRQIRAGKLRPFAVSSSKRASALPDVPTMQEAGIAGFDIPMQAFSRRRHAALRSSSG